VTGQSEPETYPETYNACAYWGPRKEAPEECAWRTADFLSRLASCDPFLAHWYKSARSVKDSLKSPLTPRDLPTLTAAFKEGVNREGEGPAFEELGFRVSLYNGGTSRAYAALNIRCGMSVEAGANSCVLSPLKPGRDADRVLTAPVLTAVVRSMVHPWEPDWAIATSTAQRVQEPDSAPFSLGWITYLSRRLGKVPPLPTPVSIEPIEDKGTLIVLTSERFTTANPEHLALARRVRELLATAGLLRPTAH
jgi:hypothetical protein